MSSSDKQQRKVSVSSADVLAEPAAFIDKQYTVCKLLRTIDLYRMSLPVYGDIVECGVHRGVSFNFLLRLSGWLDRTSTKKFYGFDTFAGFPSVEDIDGQAPQVREGYLDGANREIVYALACNSASHRHEPPGNCFELIEGDAIETIPRFVEDHPALSLSYLSLDFDLYRPTLVALEQLYPRLNRGGVLFVDDASSHVYPGVRQAMTDYFAGQSIAWRKLPYDPFGCYLIKE